MTGSAASRVDDPEDLTAIEQLVLRERQARDRGWYDDQAACFADDAYIEMSWFRGSAADFIGATRRRGADGVWGRHRLSPPTVTVCNDRGWAELPLAIEFRLKVDDVEADLISYCRSQYRAERRAGVWHLTRITSIYERDTLMAAFSGQSLRIDPEGLADYRSSYRFLAWYFERDGARLPDDLPGDDRPETAKRVYDAVREWLEE